jgi:hypothetical protein
LILSASLVLDSNKISINALIDNGASGYAFISEDFVRRHQIKTYTLKNPRHLEVIDGRPIKSGIITQVAHLGLEIQEDKETAPFFVTKQGHYPIVLGFLWIQHHDIAIRFSSNTVTFDSPKCKQACTSSQLPTTAE